MTVEVETTGTGAETTGGTDSSAAIATDQSVETGGDGSAPPQTPAFTPNFKYKVHGQEKEMDEWLRAAIKDADTEKKARDLYTRADGIDHVKQDRERLVEENQTIRQEQENFQKTVQELDFYVKQDDLTSFFERLQIPREQVLKWALREVEMADNPAARQQYDMQRQQRVQNYYQQIEGSQALSQYEQAAANLRGQETDFALRQPDIAPMVEAFDTRMGYSGAFRNAVIERGQLHAHARQVDVPVDQVIKEVIQLAGLGNTQVAAPQTATTGPSNQVIQGSKGKPVLPSIPSSGQSAVKKNPGKGLAGLRKVAQEKLAQQA